MENEAPRFSESTLNALGKLIYEKAFAYFSIPENKTKFEAWHLEKYGVPYVWKTRPRQAQK